MRGKEEGIGGERGGELEDREEGRGGEVHTDMASLIYVCRVICILVVSCDVNGLHP